MSQIKSLVAQGLDGADIIHGVLKNEMYMAENELIDCAERDSFEEKYWEGYMDALTNMYKLTYDIAFAKGDLNG
jgi:hypothetical protein